MVERQATALVLSILLAWPWVNAWAAEDAAAVILLYHHVSDETPASTSVSPALFEAHLEYLETHDYQVVPLSRIIAALRSERPLPERSVAITFDDAYLSVYTAAAPVLQERGWPFTVFATTDYLDGNYSGYLTWDQLRELERGGAEIGNHSRSHSHYMHRRAGESEAAWRARVLKDMRWAQTRLAAELQMPLDAFAYPYGEFDHATAQLVAASGLIGFGQQSGPVDPRSDPLTLPRFPMAGRFAELGSLAEKLRTRVLHVSVRAPDSALLAAGSPAPALVLQLEAGQADPHSLSCFVTGQPPPTVRWLDLDAGVVEVQAQRPLPVGRSKYTCTAPVPGAPGSYFWYSHLWMKPPTPDDWYDG